MFSDSTNGEVPPPRANNWEEVVVHVVAELKRWEADDHGKAERRGDRQLAGS